MTRVILGPQEKVQKQCLVSTRRADDTLYGIFLGTLTTKRVFAEDELGTLIFNFYIKDIDRAEIRKSFWKGAGVRLILRSGNDFVFKLMKDAIYEDAVAAQVWVNSINQVLLVLRNQAVPPPS